MSVDDFLTFRRSLLDRLLLAQLLRVHHVPDNVNDFEIRLCKPRPFSEAPPTFTFPYFPLFLCCAPIFYPLEQSALLEQLLVRTRLHDVAVLEESSCVGPDGLLYQPSFV